jgi:pimeloyl-ACP methyl ester carboxylesterase
MMADDYAGLICRLGLERARIVGCSMGSTIAQQLALRYPELVRSLVLMCPWARCDSYAKAVFQHIVDCKARLRPEEFLEYIQLLIFSKGSWDDATIRGEMVESRVQMKFNPDPQPLHALEAQATACSDHDVYALLPKIRCPSLVIGGASDIFTPVWMAREVASQIPGSDLYLYDAAGHAFHWERLDDFNCRVLEWLQRT